MTAWSPCSRSCWILLLGDDNDPPQLGVMKTDNMGGNVFTVVGALEKIKLQLLDEIESE
jgi:hypothetical protein